MINYNTKQLFDFVRTTDRHNLVEWTSIKDSMTHFLTKMVFNISKKFFLPAGPVTALIPDAYLV